MGPGFGDADTLVLLFASTPQSCANPELGVTCPDSLVWQTVLIVPQDLVRVGVVDLGNPRIAQVRWYFQSAGGSTTCDSSIVNLGLGPGGTLELLATDATSLSIKLSGGVVGLQDPPLILDGTYTVPRCGTAPATLPPRAGVAIRGSSLPADLPSNPTIGTTVDPTALYVFLGTETQTCSAPLSALSCDGAARLVLKIPAALQQTGTLDLSDPELAASVAIAAKLRDGELHRERRHEVQPGDDRHREPRRERDLAQPVQSDRGDVGRERRPRRALPGDGLPVSRRGHVRGLQLQTSLEASR